MELPDYLQTPGILIKDKDILPVDYMVYGIIYWVVGMKLQKCFMSNKQIAKLISVSESSVSHGLSRLSKKGYVTVIMDDKFHRIELIPNITFTPPSMRTKKTPSKDLLPPTQPVATPLAKDCYPPSKSLLHNKTNYKKELIKRINTSTNVEEATALGAVQEFGNKDINEGIALLRRDKEHITKEKMNRWALKRLYQSKTKLRVLKAWEFANDHQEDRYCPVIKDFIDLEQKWISLETYGKRQGKLMPRGIDVAAMIKAKKERENYGNAHN